jgi:hypothetical protein
MDIRIWMSRDEGERGGGGSNKSAVPITARIFLRELTSFFVRWRFLGFFFEDEEGGECVSSSDSEGVVTVWLSLDAAADASLLDGTTARTSSSLARPSSGSSILGPHTQLLSFLSSERSDKTNVTVV